MKPELPSKECPSCGELQPPDSRFCSYCGYSFAEEIRPYVSEAARIGAARRKYGKAVETLSEALVNLAYVQSAIRQTTSTLSEVDLQKISTDVAESTHLTDQMMSTPSLASKRARAVVEPLAEATWAVRRDVDRFLGATQESLRLRYREQLLEDSTFVKTETIATIQQLSGVIHKPKRIWLVAWHFILDGLIIATLSFPLLGFSLVSGALDRVVIGVVAFASVVAGFGLRRMRLWAAQLGVVIQLVGIIAPVVYGNSLLGTVFLIPLEILLLYFILSVTKYYVGPPILPASSAVYVSVAGGLLAFLSIILPWWSLSIISNSTATLDIGLLAQRLSVLLLGSFTLRFPDSLQNAIRVTFFAMTSGGALGLMGARYKIARVFGASAVTVGIFAFISEMTRTLSSLELPLNSHGNVFLVNASWGLTYGSYVAMISVLFLLGSFALGREKHALKGGSSGPN